MEIKSDELSAALSVLREDTELLAKTVLFSLDPVCLDSTIEVTFKGYDMSLTLEREFAERIIIRVVSVFITMAIESYLNNIVSDTIYHHVRDSVEAAAQQILQSTEIGPDDYEHFY